MPYTLPIEEYNAHVLMKFEERLRQAKMPEHLARYTYSKLQDALQDGVEFKELAERVRTKETE